MLLDAFINVKELKIQVQQHQYDLISPDGLVIPPQAWEGFIEPDMMIKMSMRPRSRSPPRRKRPSEPPMKEWRPPPAPPVIVNLTRKPTKPPPRKAMSWFSRKKSKSKSNKRRASPSLPHPRWVNRATGPAPVTLVSRPSMSYAYAACDCDGCTSYDTYDYGYGRLVTLPPLSAAREATTNTDFPGYTRRELGSHCDGNDDEAPIFELEA
jgi:hypothetical protein